MQLLKYGEGTKRSERTAEGGEDKYVSGNGRMVSGRSGRGDNPGKDDLPPIGTGKIGTGDCGGNGNLAGRSKGDPPVKRQGNFYLDFT